MSYHLGVDLGTTYTAAAIGRDGRVESATLGTRSVSIPSVVCLADDRLLVGEPAARRAVTDPHRVAREFKRRVGDTTPLLLGGSPVSAELCMARVVEWVVGQVAATEGTAPASLTLTHPANWGEYKLDLLRQALHHVDLVVDRFVPEPVAAATAYAAQRSLAPGAVVAVYDLGGGTFDAALVQAGPVAGVGARIIGRPDGIERLGGIDFDHAVFRHVLAAIGIDLDRLDADDPQLASGLAQLRQECVAAKEALSHETDVSIPVMLPQRHTEVRLTRSEFEGMIRPALDETLVALRRAVASADVAVEDVAAVLLVGGSSRIPLVGQLVGAELGRPVAVDARPKDAISLGAALVAMAGPAVAGAGVDATVPLAAVSAPVADTDRAALGRTAPPPTPPGPPRAGPATPPGGWPAPPPTPAASGGPGSRRILLAALAAVIVVAGIAGALVLFDDDEPQASRIDDTTTEDTTTTDTTDDTTDDTRGASTTGDPLGGLDPGGLGGPVDDRTEGQATPLPGDDWGDEAQAQFMTDCTSGLAAEAAAVGIDPTGMCSCLYDDAAASRDFADFNEAWSAEDVDQSNPEVQWLTGAIFSCASGGAA